MPQAATLRSAAGRPHHRPGDANDGTISRTLAVGLDLGSALTRCLILSIEDGRLRYLGHGEVSSHGWHKGRLADQEASHACARDAVQAAEAQAGVSVDAHGGGHRWRRASTATTAAAFTNSAGRAPIGLDDMAYAVERSEQVRLEEDRMILHLFPQDFTLDGRSGKRYPRGSICSRLEANVHIVTVSEQEHDSILAAVHQASYAVEETMFEPVATAYASVNRDDRNRGVAVVDIGKHSTDLVVYDGEAVLAGAQPADFGRPFHARRRGRV